MASMGPVSLSPCGLVLGLASCSVARNEVDVGQTFSVAAQAMTSPYAEGTARCVAFVRLFLLVLQYSRFVL